MEHINSFPKVWKSKNISEDMYTYVYQWLMHMQQGLNTPLTYSGTIKLKYEDLV